MDAPSQEQDFASVKARLDEIVEAVSDSELPLDDALELYEEAVTLGLRVSDLLEEGVDPLVETDEADGAQSGEDAQDVAASDSETAQEAATPASGSSEPAE